MGDTTTVQVSKEFRDWLRKREVYPDEPIENIMKRLTGWKPEL